MTSLSGLTKNQKEQCLVTPPHITQPLHVLQPHLLSQCNLSSCHVTSLRTTHQLVKKSTALYFRDILKKTISIKRPSLDMDKSSKRRLVMDLDGLFPTWDAC